MALRFLVQTPDDQNNAVAYTDDLDISTGWNFDNYDLRCLTEQLDKEGIACRDFSDTSSELSTCKTFIELRLKDHNLPIARINIGLSELFNRIQDAQLHHKPCIDLLAESSPETVYLKAVEAARITSP